MRHRHSSFTALGVALAIGLYAMAPGAARSQEAPVSSLRLVSSRVSVAGTSNIHAYTASTTAARLVRVQVASGALGAWDDMLKPGGLEAFEIAIPAATLSSPKDGIDKNMHKALKVAQYPDIVFRLSRLEPGGAPGAARAVGVLTIAGVSRELALNLKTQRGESTFTVSGVVRFLMTDFGVTPPTALLGALKTDPKVTVSFETTFTTPLT
jgi:polyisoprenoid-binding protein YceI